MATITPVESSPAINIKKIFWETVTSADTATAHQPNGKIFGSIQVTGDFGTNASVALHGSNDGTNFAALEDSAGNAIAITAAAIADFTANVLQFRPVVTLGTAEDLDVTVILRE